MVKISSHARKRLHQRGINEEDIITVLNQGEELYEDRESRHGNRLDFGDRYLVVIWTYRGEEKEIVTAYWRNKKHVKYKFID